MEYLPGRTLNQHVRKMNIKEDGSEEKMKSIIRQIVSGLNYIHSNDIVHRDIKLDNILIDPATQQIKLIDFGFSTYSKSDQKLPYTCGTPHYISPELVSKRDYYGKPADMWAFGVVMFALLTGKMPFTANFEEDLNRKIT